MCAPPDFERQTTAGISRSRSRRSMAARSSGYSSMSRTPNLHWLSSLIGMEPTPFTVQVGPDKFEGNWSANCSRLCLLLPGRRSSEIIVCPCADLKPSKAAMNLSSKFIAFPYGWVRAGGNNPILILQDLVAVTSRCVNIHSRASPWGRLPVRRILTGYVRTGSLRRPAGREAAFISSAVPADVLISPCGTSRRDPYTPAPLPTAP